MSREVGLRRFDGIFQSGSVLYALSDHEVDETPIMQLFLN